MKDFLAIFVFLQQLLSLTASRERPNIVIIMADDMGFHDISLHGSEVPTPNIDALAMHGIALNRFYVPPMCTPSRASIFTGKYPTHVGMQHWVIDSDEPWGLSPDDKIMPEIFQEAGYATHLVGKWHLGFFKKEFTPNERGFDSFFGYLGPFIGYYNHMLFKHDRANYTPGYDMRRDYEISYETNGTYATELFTKETIRVIDMHNGENPLFLMLNHLAPHAGNAAKPLEAPEEKLKRFSYIKDEQRRHLAAMVSVLDDGVGEIVQALKVKGMLDNTIILFYSDNGAPTIGLHANKGSNHPLRGQKNSPWEGGSRVPAVLWHSKLANRRVFDHFMHVSDILPTFATAAGIKLGSFMREIDGVDQWQALSTISSEKFGIRRDMLYNIDADYAAYMQNGWKIVVGSTSNGIYDGWLGNFIEENAKMNTTFYQNLVRTSLVHQSMSSKHEISFEKLKKIECHTDITPCNPLESPCLFNILEDPCETRNLAASENKILTKLLANLEKYRQSALPYRNQPPDFAANPRNFNDTWAYWCENDVETSEKDTSLPQLPILLILSVSATTLIALLCSINAQKRKKLHLHDRLATIFEQKTCINNNNIRQETALSQV
ncbi:arylsulfatase B-like [Culicoides brevitarsis]|uniref:arylsulfatase B-like n=1 Tax=Culicoides brevitarsis TaxID=469753 RepID=UPI00307C9142